jgi:hypothetical protein
MLRAKHEYHCLAPCRYNTPGMGTSQGLTLRGKGEDEASLAAQGLLGPILGGAIKATLSFPAQEHLTRQNGTACCLN